MLFMIANLLVTPDDRSQSSSVSCLNHFCGPYLNHLKNPLIFYWHFVARSVCRSGLNGSGTKPNERTQRHIKQLANASGPSGRSRKQILPESVFGKAHAPELLKYQRKRALF